MVAPADIYLAAARVIFFYVLFFIYIPGKFISFQDEDGLLDRVFISMTCMAAVTIVIVHLLVFIKLYETFSLLLAYLLAYLAITWFQSRRSPENLIDALRMKVVATLLDTVDNVGGVKNALQLYFINLKEKNMKNLLHAALRLINPLEGLLPLAILIYSAYLRFAYSFRHATLGASDSYEHLAWVKYLGDNDIYHDGIYFMGQHAVLSALGKLSLMDPYLIIRFMGPGCGFLMVLSVYYFALKISNNHLAAVLSTLVYGTVTSPLFPSLISRQIAVLPQEFSIAFALPGLLYALRYLTNRQNRDLWLYGTCQAVTLLIHLYAGVYLIIWCTVAVALRTLFYGFEPVKIFRLGLAGFLAAVISLLPFGLAFALGKRLFLAASEYARSSVTVGQNDLATIPIWQRFWASNIFLDAVFYLALLLIIMSIILFFTELDNKKRHFPWEGYLAFVAMVMYFCYRADYYHLPMLMEPYRTGIIFSPIAASFLGPGINRLFFPGRVKIPGQLVQKGILLALVIAVGAGIQLKYPPSPPDKDVTQYEHDAAAANYLSISTGYPALQWTLVGPSEQYQQALGRGWHYQIVDFVRDFSLEEAKDKNFKLPIPTQYIFVYTEKRLVDGKVISDANLKTPLKTSVQDPDKEFYRDPGQRAAIEARAMAWLEAYRKSHNGVNIYYEDDNMKIYLIEHEPPAQVK